MRWIMKVMGQGLAVLLPIMATVGIVVWAGMFVERLLANPLKGLFPGDNEAYRMGMGILFFLVLVFAVGLLMRLWIVRVLFDWVERRFKRLPLVKTLFGAIQDVMKFVAGGASGGGKPGDMVVMVTTERGWRQAGIVTRQEFEDLPPALSEGGEDLIAVYVPFSYQLGGFTYFMERSECTPVPGMSVEDVMRYAMMAWLGSSEKKPEKQTPGTP